MKAETRTSNVHAQYSTFELYINDLRACTHVLIVSGCILVGVLYGVPTYDIYDVYYTSAL